MRLSHANRWRALAALASILALPVSAAAQTSSLPTLQVITLAAALEGDSVNFRVWRSSETSQPVTVQYATSRFCPQPNYCPTGRTNATSGTDFTATSGTLTFGANEIAKTVSVPTTEDSSYEFNETFTLVLSNPTNATLHAASTRATGRIDDDDRPTVSVSDASATEGDTLEFTLSLSAAVPEEMGRGSVYYDLDPGTADASDFTVRKGGFLVFRTGTTSVTVRVSTTDDAISEEDETFSIRLYSTRWIGLGDATATGTIIDESALSWPTVSVSDASATEGDTVEFTVSLSAASAEPVTFRWRTSDGTAEMGLDYTQTGGRSTFAPGEETKRVRVRTFDNAIAQHDRTFTVTLSSPTYATLGDSTATGMIIDDDSSSPRVSLSDGSATEGDAVEFTVSLSAASAQQVTVQYATSSGTAASGTDFTAASGTVTFGATEMSKTVSVSTTNDSLDEENETFTLTLLRTLSSPTNATLGDATATGTIIDNDGLPTVSASDGSASEGDAVEFTVSLSAASSQQVTVQYATSGGTAASGTDFTAASGTLTFVANETSKTVSVSTTNDSLDEENETFTLTLSSPTHATLGDATATGDDQ